MYKNAKLLIGKLFNVKQSYEFEINNPPSKICIDINNGILTHELDKIYSTNIDNIIIIPLIIFWYLRKQEREADIKAVKSLRNKQGLIALFTRIKKTYTEYESRFALKRFFYKFIKPIVNLFSTHPSLDERIAYLKALELTEEKTEESLPTA